MKTNVTVKCDIHVDLGSTGGYTQNDDLQRLRKYFFAEASKVINETLAGSSLKASNMKMIITMEDE